MKETADTTKPRLIEGIDVYKLAIGPVEAFVLSRVDGRSDNQDITFATGLPAERVEAALRLLAQLGAISYSVATVSRDTKQRRSSPIDESPVPAGLAEPVTSYIASNADGSYDASELDADVDLDIEKKRLVLDKYYRLESMNHYAALGLSADADRKSIKSAYYGLVAEIHPDKHFGKNLGSFRPKMEKCFERITEAYNVLSRQTTRDEYDAYLKSQQQAAELQRALEMQVTAEELERLEYELLRIADATISIAPPTSGKDSENNALNRKSSGLVNIRVLTDQERRQALASALRRGPSGRPGGANVGATQVSTPDLRAASRDALKQLYEVRIHGAKQAKLKSHLQTAQDAMTRNDPIAACQALKLAQQLAPEDVAIAGHLAAVQGQANTVLADRLLEQAKYEERHEHFVAASRNYAHAATTRPTAELWEKAARCALQAKADLRFAAEMTKNAIELSSPRADLHVLLAEIYLEARLLASALAELDRAARLAPNDGSIRNLRRRLDRGGN